MGTPVPGMPPIIEDFGYYAAFVDAFQGLPHPYSCNSPFVASLVCCVSHTYASWWLSNDMECKKPPSEGYEMCNHTGGSAQRVKNLHGPYATLQDCLDAEGL